MRKEFIICPIDGHKCSLPDCLNQTSNCHAQATRLAQETTQAITSNLNTIDTVDTYDARLADLAQKLGVDPDLLDIKVLNIIYSPRLN